MADCGKTEVFLAEWKRMCKCYPGVKCKRCPAYSFCKSPEDTDETMISAVQKWSDEHPEPKPKTYADDFFEKHPDARCVESSFEHNGHLVPRVMRCAIYKGCGHTQAFCDAQKRVQCWNEPYEEREG